jgi:hypothetical protein
MRATLCTVSFSLSSFAGDLRFWLDDLDVEAVVVGDSGALGDRCSRSDRSIFTTRRPPMADWKK